MRTIPIAGTDLKLSAMCIGNTLFNPNIPPEVCESLYRRYRQAGGNVLDTGHCYCFWLPNGNATNERNLGRVVRAHGDAGRMLVFTKGGHPAADGYPRPDRYLSPEAVDRDVSESLERLQMDKVDLYFLHRDDRREPVSGIMEMLNRHIAAGHFPYIGASNWTTARIAEANAYAASHGLRGFALSQIQFNLAHNNSPPPASDREMRWLTEEEVAWHTATQTPAMCFSPTALGYFASNGERGGKEYDNPISRARLARVKELAGQLGATPNQIALAWVMNQKFPTFPMLGTSSVSHLAEALDAASIHLSDQQVCWLRDG